MSELRVNRIEDLTGAVGADVSALINKANSAASVVVSIAALRALSVTTATAYAIVLGVGMFQMVSSGTENGYTTIVATDGTIWKMVDAASKLPQNSTPYIITNGGMRLDYPLNNILKNSGFGIWHDTGLAAMSSSMAENTEAMICAQWRMETSGLGTTVSAIQKIASSPVGGLSFTTSFGSAVPGSVYVRQNCLGVQSFSGRMLTATVDIEVSQACSLNFYASLRLTSNNSIGFKPLIVDSPLVALPAGRSIVAITMNCPDISSRIGEETAQNSLEYSFKIVEQNKVILCKVRGCSIVPGHLPASPGSSDPVRDLIEAETQFEQGTGSFTGFSATSGQKRITVPFRTPKYRLGTLTYSDLAGNVGKVSTYDTSGARTDNVTPTTVAYGLNEITVVINASTAAGIAVNYAVSSYY